MSFKRTILYILLNRTTQPTLYLFHLIHLITDLLLCTIFISKSQIKRKQQQTNNDNFDFTVPCRSQWIVLFC